MTHVYCQTRFIGFHKWPEAPLSLSYLRQMHRHEFHVKLICKVTHDNRDIEFLTLKERLDSQLECRNWPDESSCEMMCKYIAEWFKDDVVQVEVSEDGENGAILVCQ